MLWLTLPDFSNIPCVSKEFLLLSSSDEIWRSFYASKFLVLNPNTIPKRTSAYKNLYHFRLLDPEIGDHIEVLWKGNFRLESTDTYQGSAWWIAEIVDKHSSHSKYKVHYPGWDSKWDEWIPKSRLRRKVDGNNIEKIQVNDIVELWCCGNQVPGAWLETFVKKIKNEQYCVGDVLLSGDLWVHRNRIRLVSKPTEEQLSNMKKSLRHRYFHPSAINIEQNFEGNESYRCSIM